MILSERFKKFLFRRQADTPTGMRPGDNPIIRERGSVFVRFDAIEITNADDEFGGVNIGFRFVGHTHVTLRVEGIRLDRGDVLTINGIEGRQRVTLE